MGHLDEVVSRDGARHDHHFATDLTGERLSYISLLFILLPVCGWKYLEVFEDIDVGVLPHRLDDH